MSSIPTLVEARRDNLVVQELPDETLIFDLKSQRAHCLNQTAAFVWNHCDGGTPPTEIAALMEKKWRKPVGEDAVWVALKQLNQANLLQNAPVFPAGVSRRAAMRKIGLAAAVVLPLVISITAPTAVSAQTLGPGQCITDLQCNALTICQPCHSIPNEPCTKRCREKPNGNGYQCVGVPAGTCPA
jgi:hypothetical protein